MIAFCKTWRILLKSFDVEITGFKRVFEPGKSGNANGRPVGVRDKKYRKYQEAAEREQLEDPVLFQHRKLQDESIDIAVRASIASNISPYYYPKWGTTSPPPAPIYIETPIDLPPPTTIEEAKSNIAKLISHLAKGEIDHASYDRLITGNVAMVNALLGHDKLLVAQGTDTGGQVIRVEGGLPELPGTNITMPMRIIHNGHAMDGHALAAPEPAVPDPEPAANESTPEEAV